MNAAEKMFRTYFASASEYKAFLSKHEVKVLDKDYAGRKGCGLDVLGPDGFPMSYDDKPASISIARFSYRNYDFNVSWCDRDPSKARRGNEAKLVRHRPEANGPAWICMFGGKGFEQPGLAKLYEQVWFVMGERIREEHIGFTHEDVRAKRKLVNK